MRTFKEFLAENHRFVTNHDELFNIVYNPHSDGIDPVPRRPGTGINKDGTITARKRLVLGVMAEPNTDKMLEQDGNGYRLRVILKSATNLILNQFTTLEGIPKTMPVGQLTIMSDVLKDYSFIPREIGEIRISCPNTQFVGGSATVDGHLQIDQAFNKSLSGLNKVFPTVYGSITIKTINLIDEDTITSRILSIFMIKGNFRVWTTGNDALQNIINKNMRDRDILACQEELISAGLKEYAKL